MNMNYISPNKSDAWYFLQDCMFAQQRLWSAHTSAQPDQSLQGTQLVAKDPTYLAHCILNRLPHTIYWKSPILILGTSGYET